MLPTLLLHRCVDKYKIMMFGQKSFVVIYFKGIGLENSLEINSLDVSHPASKDELRTGERVSGCEDGLTGQGAADVLLRPALVSSTHGCRSELVNFPLQVLQHGVHALG